MTELRRADALPVRRIAQIGAIGLERRYDPFASVSVLSSAVARGQPSFVLSGTTFINYQ